MATSNSQTVFRDLQSFVLSAAILALMVAATTGAANAAASAIIPQSSIPSTVTSLSSVPDEVVQVIQLPPVSDSENARWRDASSTGLKLIGHGRSIPEAGKSTDVSRQSRWYRLSDGRKVFTVRMVSPAAVALRLGLRILELPDTAILRFAASNSAPTQSVSGAQVHTGLARNRLSGRVEEGAEIYWSPLIEGDAIVLEVEIPASDDPVLVSIAPSS